jgi:hypothetical protein
MDRHQLPALSGPQYSVPVVIDYPAALALRQMALVQGSAKISAGAGGERPAPLRPGPSPQDAAGDALEYGRAH